METPAAREDLLMLQDSELTQHVQVRCSRCYGPIRYYQDSQDALLSGYECRGTLWVEGQYVECDNFWLASSLETCSLDSLRATVYIVLTRPNELLHKRCLEEYVGTQAYTYLRLATEDEYWEEARRRLNYFRLKARKAAR